MSQFLFNISIILVAIIGIAFLFEKVIENRLFQRILLGIILIIGILLLCNIFTDKQDGLSYLIRSAFVLMLGILLMNFKSSLISMKHAVIWGIVWIVVTIVLLIVW